MNRKSPNLQLRKRRRSHQVLRNLFLRAAKASSASSSKDTFLDKRLEKVRFKRQPEQFFNQTFDSNLYRNSRIVVPVDLQIYVVENQTSKSVYDLTQIFDDDERDRPRRINNNLPRVSTYIGLCLMAS